MLSGSGFLRSFLRNHNTYSAVLRSTRPIVRSCVFEVSQREGRSRTQTFARRYTSLTTDILTSLRVTGQSTHPRKVRPTRRTFSNNKIMAHPALEEGSGAVAGSSGFTLPPLPSGEELSQIETAKRKAAFQAVYDNFQSSMRFVGIGSGSTIVYGVEAIKHFLTKNPPPSGHMNWFVPTGWNSRKVIEQAGLYPIAFDSLPADAMIEVCFDGADEVDEELNCIKGGGACLFQEKLVACRSRKFICIADYRKDQARLLTNWPTIPIEVAPISFASVLRDLKLIGSENPLIREHTLSKTGPVQTDQSFYIIDAPFKQLLTAGDVKAGKDGSGKDGVWSVDQLAKKIKSLHGVLEVGLFHGPTGNETQAAGLQGGQKPVSAYFGLENGEVKRRDAPAVNT